MPLDLKYAVALKAAKLNAISTFAGASAKLRIYSGTKPATSDTAITGTLLVELICNATAFAATTSTATLTANAIANGTAVATGVASHYRIFKADGTSAAIDGTVGTTASDLIIDNTSINSGQVVSVSSSTFTEAN